MTTSIKGKVLQDFWFTEKASGNRAQKFIPENLESVEVFIAITFFHTEFIFLRILFLKVYPHPALYFIGDLDFFFFKLDAIQDLENQICF